VCTPDTAVLGNTHPKHNRHHYSTVLTDTVTTMGFEPLQDCLQHYLCHVCLSGTLAPLHNAAACWECTNGNTHTPAQCHSLLNGSHVSRRRLMISALLEYTGTSAHLGCMLGMHKRQYPHTSPVPQSAQRLPCLQ
jgi:hypothetical protein